MKNKQIKLLVERYPVLKAIENEVFNAYQILENCYAHGGKLLVAGNGGSAADAEHIVGELMKGFKLPRKPDADSQKSWLRKIKNLVLFWQKICRGHFRPLLWMGIRLFRPHT